MLATRDTFLVIGARFRVVQLFLCYPVGTEIELVARTYDPHNAAHTWSFVAMTDRRSAELSELAEDHVPLLRDLERYLVAA